MATAVPVCRTARKRSAQARSWKPGRRRQPSGARERWTPDRGETRAARLDALRARQRDRPLLRWPGTPERKVAFTMTLCPRQNTPIPTIPWNTCSSARRPCTNGSTNCSTAPISTAPHASGLEVLRNSNGLRTMIAMMMAILSGDEAITIPMGKAQPAFADCPPDLLKP